MRWRERHRPYPGSVLEGHAGERVGAMPALQAAGEHLMLVRVRLGVVGVRVEVTVGRTMHRWHARRLVRSARHGVAVNTGWGKGPGRGSPVHESRGWQKRLDANEPGTSVPS